MGVVVITGASSGIGEAAARELAARGHKLVLAARRTDRLDGLAAELSPSAEVLVVPCDVAEAAQVEALAAAALERFGAIDVWINNAGVGHVTPWWDESAESIERVAAVNFVAPLVAARAVIGHMKARGRGQIINVASVAGHIGTQGLYAGTKWGLRGFSEALRRELKPFGIAVTVVSPGFIRTEMTQKLPFRMPGPDLVARVLANVIERPRREVVVPGWYRPLTWLNWWFPALVDAGWGWFMQKRQPGS